MFESMESSGTPHLVCEESRTQERVLSVPSYHLETKDRFEMVIKNKFYWCHFNGIPIYLRGETSHPKKAKKKAKGKRAVPVKKTKAKAKAKRGR